MRRLWALVFFLIPALLVAQDKPVTCTARALPLHVVVDELAKQGGAKLRVDADMGDEPLILRLDHVPLKEAMGKIADVFAADWVDHQEFVRLERSPKKVSLLKAALLEKRKQAIRERLAEMRRELDSQPTFDQAVSDGIVARLREMARKQKAGVQGLTYGEVDDAINQLPLGRLATAILVRMDPAELAEIPVGKRVVFSNQPGPMQRPLSAIPSELLERFNAERKLVLSSVESVPESERNGLWLLEDLRRGSQAPIDRVIVSLVPYAHSPSLTLSFVFADSSGGYVGEQWLSLAMTPGRWADDFDQLPALQKSALKTGFELGPIAREVAPRAVPTQTGPMRPLSIQAREALLNPTAQDPLSMATSDIVLTSAQRLGVNAICLAPDTTESVALHSASLGKTELATFQTVAEKGCSLEFAKDSRWLVVKPSDPLDVADARLSRPLLQSFIQSAIKQGRVSIDLAAELCGSAGPGSTFDLANQYVHYLLPDDKLVVLEDYPHVFRLLGKLSTQQRETAARGKLRVRVADLTQEQRAVAFDMVFNCVNQLEEEDSAPESRNRPEALDRTDFLPEGISDDMVLEMTDRSEPVIYLARGADERQRGLYATSIRGLPNVLAQVQHPELFGTRDVAPITGITRGVRRNVQIRFVQKTKSVGDPLFEDIPSCGRPMTLEDFMGSLPIVERQRMEADVDRIVRDQAGHLHAVPSPQVAPVDAKPPLRRAS